MASAPGRGQGVDGWDRTYAAARALPCGFRCSHNTGRLTRTHATGAIALPHESVIDDTGQVKNGFLPVYRASFLVDVLPGVVLLMSGYAAALPAFRIVRQSSRGRARTALAWICGFATGLLTMLLFSLALPLPHAAGSVSAKGIVGAFVGPFVGILYGRWLGPEKKKRRPLDVAHMAPRQPSA
jgi:hypothetical protein